MSAPVSRIIPPLSYLNVAEYVSPRGHVNDYSSTPRPHNCISLFVKGGAVFSCGEEKVTVTAGDLVFVPWQSLYVSEFFGDPATEYITVHCNFDPSDFCFRSADYSLQKLTNMREVEDDFRFMRANIGRTDYVALEVMQRFYSVMGKILPRLTPHAAPARSAAVLSVLAYLEERYFEDVTGSRLAELAAMSESQFYLAFKQETGLTPVEYKNHIRIRHAVNLLYGDLSVEAITTALGFNSATYFRKVFKKATGFNPLDYKHKVLNVK